MILGIPDFIFVLLAMLGVSLTFSVIMLVLYFLAPGNAKKLLSARLKKTGLLAIFGKASLRFVKVKSIAPGWVETEEGKKYIWPIPPKEKSESWSPVRDVISKVERIDNIPVLTVYEAECLASNADTLVSLEAYTKGYNTEQLPFPVNPGSNPGQSKFKVYIPVNPKLLTETLRGMMTSEHIDVFRTFIIEWERRRRLRDERMFIIKTVTIIGLVTIVAIIALLIVSGHI